MTDTCMEQVKRCSGLDFFPVTREGVRELARVLAKYSHSEEHAKRIVDAWIERSPKAPTPADLIDYAQEISVKPELPNGCGRCQRGWRFISRMELDFYLVSKENVRRRKEGIPPIELDWPEDEMPRQFYTERHYQARCGCALGKRLEQIFQEHVAMEKARQRKS